MNASMNHRTTRRSFLKMAAAVGGVASATSLLAACATPAVTTPAPQATTAPETGMGEAMQGGTLVSLWGGPINNFNPLQAVQGCQQQLFSCVLPSLVDMNPEKTEYVPNLAESWEISDDVTEYTFHIRPNANWHDGTPVTAADVEWTFMMGLNPATKSRWVSALQVIKGGKAYSDGAATTVEGIQVIDDKTIKFVLDAPNILFFEQVRESRSILPKHILGEVAPADLEAQLSPSSSPVGSGPFKFVQYVTDQFLEVEANEDYWGGRPKLDKIIFRIINAPDTAQIALERAEVDWNSWGGISATPEVIESFLANPDFNVVATKGTVASSYAFNLRQPHWADKRVRQAWFYALDRAKLIQTFAGGNGSIYDTALIHSWIATDDMTHYSYDPEKAKQLLADAGWDSNQEVVVSVITITSENARAQVAAEQQMLADVGIKVSYQEMESAVWVAGFYDLHDYDVVRVGFGTFTDPDGFLKFHMVPEGRNASGYGEYKGQEWIDLVYQAGALTDQAARQPLYLEIQKILSDDPWQVPLSVGNDVYILNKRVYIPFLTEGKKVTAANDIASAVLPIIREYHTRLNEWGVRA